MPSNTCAVQPEAASVLNDSESTEPTGDGTEYIQPTSSTKAGLCNHRIQPRSSATVTKAQLALDIATRVCFAPWENFDTDVKSIAKEVRLELRRPRHNNCNMLNHGCSVTWCAKMAAHKDDILSEAIETEADLCNHLRNVLRSLTGYLVDRKDWKGQIVAEKPQRTGTFQNSAPLSESQEDEAFDAFANLDSQVVDEIASRLPPPSAESTFVNLRPDFSARKRKASAPFCTIEVKSPNSDYFDSFKTEECDEVYMFILLRDHFEHIRSDLHKSGKREHRSWLYNSVCQTILQALHTDTGLGCLWTGNHLLVLRVMPHFYLGTRLVVFVSRLYAVDTEDCSALDAMLTLLLKSSERGKEGMYNRFTDLVKALPIPDNYSFADPNGTNSEIVTEGTPDILGTASGTGGQNNATEHAVASQSKGGEHVHPAEDLGYMLGSKVVVRSIRDAENAIECGELLVLNKHGLKRLFIPVRDAKRIVGSTGAVMPHRFNGMHLAVKKWNGLEERGLISLQREVCAYVWLWRNWREVLGDAVPRVIAIGNLGKKGLTLVTEYVGFPVEEKVALKRGGGTSVSWYVDGVKLSPSDVEEINADATRSLRKIVRCGMWHGDEAPRNLRVERVAGKGWKTWWIDLGDYEPLRADNDMQVMRQSEDVVWDIRSSMNW